MSVVYISKWMCVAAGGRDWTRVEADFLKVTTCFQPAENITFISGCSGGYTFWHYLLLNPTHTMHIIRYAWLDPMSAMWKYSYWIIMQNRSLAIAYKICPRRLITDYIKIYVHPGQRDPTKMAKLKASLCIHSSWIFGSESGMLIEKNDFFNQNLIFTIETHTHTSDW